MRTSTLVGGLILGTALFGGGALAAEPLLFANGAFVTGMGTGPSGADVSQAEPAPGVIALSFRADLAPPNGPARVGDDFVITGAPAAPAEGVRLNHMHFYGIQTQTTTTNPQFSAVYVALYDASPAAGGVLIAGDSTTNRLKTSTWTGAYRLSSSGASSTSRPITRLDVDMSWVPALHDGTYWLEVSAKGDFALSANPNPNAFFVTPHRITDNGYQYFNSTYFATWDYPFEIYGFCLSDFNHAGGTTIDDLFLYINAYFSGDAAADANGQDGVTIDDLFLFINAWFSPC